MKPSHIPSGQSAVAPFFLISEAAGFIDFLKQGFGAEEVSRMERDGVIVHALIRIGESLVMVGSRNQDHPNSTHLYVPDIDATFERCLSLGAEALSQPTTFPYGDRSAGIKDPFGNTWWLGTHLGKR
jgi:PhnB protein